MRETCKKCGHNEAYYRTAQLRSADEGQTVFYQSAALGRPPLSVRPPCLRPRAREYGYAARPAHAAHSSTHACLCSGALCLRLVGAFMYGTAYGRPIFGPAVPSLQAALGRCIKCG